MQRGDTTRCTYEMQGTGLHGEGRAVCKSPEQLGLSQHPPLSLGMGHCSLFCVDTRFGATCTSWQRECAHISQHCTEQWCWRLLVGCRKVPRTVLVGGGLFWYLIKTETQNTNDKGEQEKQHRITFPIFRKLQNIILMCFCNHFLKQTLFLFCNL